MKIKATNEMPEFLTMKDALVRVVRCSADHSEESRSNIAKVFYLGGLAVYQIIMQAEHEDACKVLFNSTLNEIKDYLVKEQVINE